jgi:hypothetical protein
MGVGDCAILARNDGAMSITDRAAPLSVAGIDHAAAQWMRGCSSLVYCDLTVA